jgi:DNA-binding response OmpR family regulator
MPADGLSSRLILSVSSDPILSSSRAQILRSSGYVVEAVDSAETAIQRFRAGDFDLVLVGHSIPEVERERLFVFVRARSRSTPVVFVAPSAEPEPDRFADITSSNLPEPLIAAVREALRRAHRTSTSIAATGPASQVEVE